MTRDVSVLDLDLHLDVTDSVVWDALMRHLTEVTVWCDIDYDSERDTFHVRGRMRAGQRFNPTLLVLAGGNG